MFPPERVTEVVECRPTHCAGCDARLRSTDPEPEVHQVAELPKIEPLVTEYRWHSLSCRCCGRSTRGQLPEGTPRGAFGPRVVSTVTELIGVYGVSARSWTARASRIKDEILPDRGIGRRWATLACPPARAACESF